MKNELKWVANARKKIGVYEIVGEKHNTVVLAMWKAGFKAVGQKSWIHDDETPWCGAFVASVMAESDLAHHIPKQFPRAKSWETAGTELKGPAYGCIVVFSRRGGGHVGIVVGKDEKGNLMVLGGNQANAVNIKPFPRHRVTAYRWCGTQVKPAIHRYALPVLKSDGKLSINEA